MIEYSFKMLLNIILPIINCDNPPPILLRAKHGVGKSSWAKELVNFLYAINEMEYGFVTRRASQQTEGDQLGLPFRDRTNNTTKYYPPDWFMEACTKPTVLLIDEIDRATLEVSQGYFELGDSRTLAGYTLHPRTVLISCVNGGENENNYNVNSMDPAFLDRWVTFDLNPTIEDWVEWGRERGGIHPEILAFVQNFPECLEVTKNMKPGKVYPSRRSWDRLNTVVAKNSKILESALQNNSEDLTKIFLISNGFVGEEAANSFKNWVADAKNKVIKPEDILNGDKVAFGKVQRFNVSEWNNHIDRWKDPATKELLHKKFANNKQKTAENVSNLLLEMPSEIFLKFWDEVVFGGEWNFDLTKAISNNEATIEGQKLKMQRIYQKYVLGRELSAIK